jgi:tetratricopeptide (TPR) repeat protein
MQFSKIGRDLAILLVAGFVLWGIYQTVSIFSASNVDELGQTAVSETRKRSDEAFLSNRWEDAIEPYQKLVNEDPFNGTAWFRLGFANWKHVQKLASRLATEESKASPDANSVQQLTAQIENHQGVAIAAFEKAMTFSLFRNSARRTLAEIYAFKQDTDKAFEILTAAIDDGYCSRSGIINDDSLSLLRTMDDPRFQELVRKEKANLDSFKFRSEQLSSAGL